MPEYSGAVQHVELSSTLRLIVAVPTLACAAFAFAGGRMRRSRVQLALTAWLGVLGAVGYHVAELFALPPTRRFLLDYLAGGARLGSFDASLALALDPLGAMVAACVTVVGGGALVVAAQREDPAVPRVLAIGYLSLGAVLVLVLADNLLVALGALGVGTIALWLGGGPTESERTRAFSAGTLGDALVVTATAFLLFATAGEWTAEGGYVPAFRPRVSAVEAPAVEETGDSSKKYDSRDGTLTVTALPGSIVTIGGAYVCEVSAEGRRGGLGTSGAPCKRRARTPFVRLPISAAIHDVRLSPGGGGLDALAEKARVNPGRETSVVVTAGTLTFRELDDQLALRDGSGAHVIRTTYAESQVLGVGVVTVILLLLAGAAVAKIAASALSRGPALDAVLVWCTGMTAAAVVPLRLGGLVSSSAAAGAGLCITGGVVALAAGYLALFESSPRRALGKVLASQLGVVMVGLGVGAQLAAALHAALAIVAGAAMSVAILVVMRTLRGLEGYGDGASLSRLAGAGIDVAWADRLFLIAAACMSVAPVPGVAGFFSKNAILTTALSTAGIGFVPGAVAWAVVAISSAMVAFASWRLYYVVFAGARIKKKIEKKRKPTSAVDVATLAACAATLLALSIGGLSLASLGVGGPEASAPLEQWLASNLRGPPPRTTPLSQGVALGQLGASFVLAVVGFGWARSRYRAREEDWKGDEGAVAGTGLEAAGGRALAGLGRLLGRSAEAVRLADERVLGVVGGIAKAVVAPRGKSSPGASVEPPERKEERDP